MTTNKTLRTMAKIPAAMAMLCLLAVSAGRAEAQAANTDSSSFLYIQPYAPPAEAPQAAAQERQAAHEQAAILARDQAKALLAQGQFAPAADIARQAIADYSDTYVATEFTEILAAAEQGLAANSSADGTQTQRHAEFMALRNRAVELYNSGDFKGAIPLFEAALAQEPNAEAAALLEECIDRTELPRLTVADFTVTGDAEIPDAGRTVAELMLSHFDPARFQLVDRSVLAEALARQNLTPGQLAENPQLLRDRFVPGVRLAVVGSIVRLDTLVIVARMIDVRTGGIVQTADVTLVHPSQLQPALSELAAILQMNNEQKQAYLDDQRRQWEQQRLIAQAQMAPDIIAEDFPTVWIRQPVVVRFLAGWDRDQRRICDDEMRRMKERRHHEEALLNLVQIRVLHALGRHDQAATIARDGFKRYGDTPFARSFTTLQTAPVQAARFAVRQTTIVQPDLNRSRPGNFATNAPVAVNRHEDVRTPAPTHSTARPTTPAAVTHAPATPVQAFAPRVAATPTPVRDNPPAANTLTTRRDNGRFTTNTTPIQRTAEPAPQQTVTQRKFVPAAPTPVEPANTPTVSTRRNLTAPSPVETPAATPTRRSWTAPTTANNPPTTVRATPAPVAPAPVATPRTIQATPATPSSATRADTANRSFARPVDRTPTVTETPKPVARHVDTPAPAPTRQWQSEPAARQAPAPVRQFAAEPPTRQVAQAAPAPAYQPPTRAAAPSDNTPRRGDDRKTTDDRNQSRDDRRNGR